MNRWALMLGLGLFLTAVVATPAFCQQAATAPDAAPSEPQTTVAPAKYTVPEPSIVPLSWQLDLRYQMPMRMVLQMPGQKQPTYYWYILYTISNPGPKDVYYLPRVQMLTDKLDIVDAQVAITPVLFKKIKDLHKAKYLEEPLQVTGKVLTGSDNARDSVALFPIKGDPKSFKIIFSGLSGEQWPIDVPATEPGGKASKVLMEKVRVLTFDVATRPPEEAPDVTLADDTWVMRSMPPKSKMDVDLRAASEGRLKDIYRAEGLPGEEGTPAANPAPAVPPAATQPAAGPEK